MKITLSVTVPPSISIDATPEEMVALPVDVAHRVALAMVSAVMGLAGTLKTFGEHDKKEAGK